MNLRNVCGLSIAVSSALYATTGLATPQIAIMCNSCTALELKNAATSIAARSSSGYVYTFDSATGVATQYSVVLSQKQGGLVAQLVGPAPNQIHQALVTQTQAVAENAGSPHFIMHFGYNQLPDPTASTFDVVEFSAIQNDISSALLGPSLLSNMDGLITALQNVFLTNLVITIDADISRPDGGTVTFEWTNGQVVDTLVKAVDQNNNTIPLTISQVPGKYRFGNGGSGPFGDYLHDHFGIDITGVNVCVNGYLACITGGSETTCEYVHCN